MPRRPPKPCEHEGCNVLVSTGRGLCGRHALDTSATTRVVLLQQDEDWGGDAA